jgi:hypothetical protein
MAQNPAEKMIVGSGKSAKRVFMHDVPAIHVFAP